MKSELMEKRQRGTQLFPFQHYKMNSINENLFVPYHWHSEIEIIYVVSGKVNLLLNGEEFLLKDNHIYFINRELLHQFSSVDSGLVYYAYVFPLEYLDFKLEDYSQTTSMNPLSKNRLFPFCVAPSTPGYKQIRGEMIELLQISENKEEGYQLNVKACLFKIISILQQKNLFIENGTTGKNSSRAVRTAEIKGIVSYIQNEYKNSVSLEEAATLLNYSPSYFCTFFKVTFGITFVEYVNHFRVEKACILLASTTLSVMEVGFEAGFKNFSYFIRVFKRIMNMTPKQYRNQSIK
ncbi:AraC family transcriptional regulator [Anaeromicropila populeti]|uniref:AraC-type DNA-binding protein n=1 Tax=Anaeromicropila populeti TaxID=37658 RepID=A0A1I6IWU0_9FIRM|nr:AraC family transcriptional regulator [Anaeromicropila populeti]SFR71163.1 AraC-type DNA-binding protein [Anaeromicropila populeti]